MHPLQALAAHVGIDLCRTQIGVTQKLLHSTKIGTSIQKMSREGVP
jgi:deoxyinosine 3'endonuclease (endonuclease V)